MTTTGIIAKKIGMTRMVDGEGQLTAVTLLQVETQRVTKILTPERDGYHGIGPTVRLSRAPARVDRLPPAYAQHTDEVLREAGLADTQIAALKELGILPRWPPPKP